jgi:hypothetical protein
MHAALKQLFIHLFLFSAGISALGMLFSAVPAQAEIVVIRPPPAPGPADNPLKGFVPYAGKGVEFPHSLEFGYLSLSTLMVGPNQFDWRPLDTLLDGVSSRGCQTVFRVWVEYPGRPSGVPAWLVADGLQIRTWTNVNKITLADAKPLPPEVHHTPDYEDARLREAIKRFIEALGRRYDGDPRIGFITAGLLGAWGEWHTHPNTKWFASKAVQAEVMDAYEAAFRQTPVLLRYPTGHNHKALASNVGRCFGYHDDSFAWSTLETGPPKQDWVFKARLSKMGSDGLNRWKTAPIGGEIRPELWPCLWKDSGCGTGQDFTRCVAETHASWLMDSSTSYPMSPEERRRAITAASSLGYEFEIVEAGLESFPSGIRVRITLHNRGVAPFYANWPIWLQVVPTEGATVETTIPLSLSQLMPGETLSKEATLKLDSRSKGHHSIRLRVPNPMKNGRPLRFANQWNAVDTNGWMTLANIGGTSKIPNKSVNESGR